MKYLLDSTFCIEHLRGQRPALSSRLEAQQPGEVALCSIVRAELRFGVERSQHRERQRPALERFLAGLPSLPFDDAAADAAARVRLDLEARGERIGPHDAMIGGIAIANGLILVTHNTGEFSRVAGLRLEDWEG